MFRAVSTLCEHISTAFHVIAVPGELSVLVLLCGVLREREREKVVCLVFVCFPGGLNTQFLDWHLNIDAI